MGGLKEAGHEPATLAIDFRPYPDACTDECEDAQVDNSAESDSNPAVMAAVRVLLQGLGEDVNRDGLKKTPLRVAKAFRDGTRGMHSICLFLCTFLHAFVGFIYKTDAVLQCSIIWT